MSKRNQKEKFRLIYLTLNNLISSCRGLLNIVVGHGKRLDDLEARVVALENKPDPFQLIGNPDTL